MTNHIDAGEYIKAQQEKLDRLRFELECARARLQDACITIDGLRAALRECHQHMQYEAGGALAVADDFVIVN